MVQDFYQYLKTIAEEKVKSSGLNLVLKVEDIPGGLQAGYDKTKETISINLKRINDNSKFEQVEVTHYLEVIICHELGHASDPELTMEVIESIASARREIYSSIEQLDYLLEGEQSFNEVKRKLERQVDILEAFEYSTEERACRLGRSFVSPSLLKIYDQNSIATLQKYRENYIALKSGE